jgi:hypothetical protein
VTEETEMKIGLLIMCCILGAAPLIAIAVAMLY